MGSDTNWLRRTVWLVIWMLGSESLVDQCEGQVRHLTWSARVSHVVFSCYEQVWGRIPIRKYVGMPWGIKKECYINILEINSYNNLYFFICHISCCIARFSLSSFFFSNLEKYDINWLTTIIYRKKIQSTRHVDYQTTRRGNILN